MSKSRGNYFTVRELIRPESEGGRGVDPLALRYALISGHYRKPFNFTLKNLRDSAKALQRYQAAAGAVRAALERDAPGEDHLGERLEAVYARTLEAMLDDLNTPEALAAALEGVRLVAGFREMSGASARSAQAWLERTNALLGIVAHEAEAPAGESVGADPFAEEVEQLLVDRTEARKARDFARADAIRDRLDALGVEVMDSLTGSTWRKKV
jgi:cysteinyl-tRNA synthetase